MYSFFDLFGFIGGIFGMLNTVGYLIIEYFVNRNFYAYVVSQLYNINEDELLRDKHNHTVKITNYETKISSSRNKQKSTKKSKGSVMPEPKYEYKEQENK